MTGLSDDQLDLLIERATARCGSWQPPRGRRRALGFAVAVTMTVVALRHNLSQALLGAFFNVSQPTVSRVVRSLAAVVGAAAAEGMPGVTDVEQAERLLVDGTLCPTGNRAGEGRQGEGLYSGKRHRAGMNTLVVADRWGRLLDASEPTRGAMHDARSFPRRGWTGCWPAGTCWAILAFLAAGSTRRCASRPVASCQRLRRSTTGRTVRPARRSSARSRC
jgi:hypothetical protein